MGTGDLDVRHDSIADVLTELSGQSAALIRQELRLMAAELTKQGARVGSSAGMLGGAGVLGVGAFGALTAALIATLGGRPSRGAWLVAGLYGAGAGALGQAGVKRLGQVAPEAVEAIQVDLKAAAKGARFDQKKPPAKPRRRTPSTKRARSKPSS
jgi:Putative Actinobacterial Holin-X, holin superfamily III